MVHLTLELKPMWQGLCAMLRHSVISDWDLNQAKAHGSLFGNLMKLRLFMSHCKISVRDTAIIKG